MKKILFILLAFLFINGMHAQTISVTITGESNVDIGVPAEYTAIFNGPDTLTVLRYEWTIPWNGDVQMKELVKPIM